MKILKSVFAVIFFVVFVTATYGEKKSDKSGSKSLQTNNTSTNQTVKTNKVKQNKKIKPKVTFIELGSVRCIPCRMMQPIMEDIKKEYKGQVEVIFYDVWTEEGRPYAMKYGIRVIPTQIFLDSTGKEYFRHEGYFPKEELVEILKTKGVK